MFTPGLETWVEAPASNEVYAHPKSFLLQEVTIESLNPDVFTKHVNSEAHTRLKRKGKRTAVKCIKQKRFHLTPLKNNGTISCNHMVCAMWGWQNIQSQGYKRALSTLLTADL